MKSVPIAVVGVGHLGKQHTRVCNLLSSVNLVAVVDKNPNTARDIAGQYRVPFYTDYRKILDKVSAVSVATPTNTHYRIVSDLLRRRIHTFVEKPITQTVAQAGKLVSLAKKYRVKLQVGHIERFNPGLTAVVDDIKHPRFIECHRLSPLSFRSMDIDVVRDLMIHDIDIVCSLVGKRPSRIYATGVPVFSRKVDIANARISFPDGCVANLTASRVSDKSMRKMRIFSRDTYASIDFLTRSAQVYRKSSRAPAPEKLLTDSILSLQENLDLKAIKDYQSLMRKRFLEIKNPQIKKTDQLESELAAFVKSIRTGKRPIVSGEDGLNALSVAEEIIRKMI